MKTLETCVLVVGGGLTGLAAALFLGQQGVPALLLERREEPNRVPRSSGVSPRSMELLHSAGLEPRIRERGCRLVADLDWQQTDWTRQPAHLRPAVVLGVNRVSQVGDGTATVLSRPDDLTHVSPMEPAWIGQNDLEPLMAEAAAAYGARLWFGTELVSFRQLPDGIEAVVQHGGDQLLVRARYLIAADGPASAVRGALGIERHGPGTLGHAVSVVFRADLDPLLAHRRFLACVLKGAKRATLFRFDPARWLCHLYPTPDQAYEDAATTLAEYEAMVRQALGEPGPALTVDSADRWRLAIEVAERYRDGNVFLAGDACHVHPPAGGLGANSGIQDAHNLAWKLAGVLRGWAGPELLDTYEQERRPVAMANAQQALLQQTRHQPGQNGSGVRKSIVTTTGYRYFSSAISGDDNGEVLEPELRIDGRPGLRVPHAWLERDGRRVSTVELAGPGFVLLAGPEADVPATPSSVPLRVHRLGGDLTDPHDAFPSIAGIGPTGALLIRPDGFVAWRTPGSCAPHHLGQALRTATGRIGQAE